MEDDPAEVLLLLLLVDPTSEPRLVGRGEESGPAKDGCWLLAATAAAKVALALVTHCMRFRRLAAADSTEARGRLRAGTAAAERE